MVEPDHHTRRVTLNLIRHAACCPEELRQVIDKLAVDYDWKLDSLDPSEMEIIFAHVNEELENEARSEFVADTRTAVDHRHEDWDCYLCGHRHIRWEFTIRNTKGGRPVKCGSTCIIEYGLNIDGEGVGESALQRLKDAINLLKRKAAMEDWQKEHPDHENELGKLASMMRWLDRHTNPWRQPTADGRVVDLRGHLQPRWRLRCFKMVKAIRAVVKYYRKNRYLTPKKTTDTYRAGGLLDRCKLMADEWRTAIRKHDNAPEPY